MSEMKEKPTMSSLGIGPEACSRKRRSGPSPCFPANPWIFHLKDDVTVTLLIGISFTEVILLILTKSPLFTEKHF
jgi:hypothetical protein